MSKSKVVFIVTGSIASYKACTVVSRLVQDGHEVRVVATPSSLEFVGAATWEGLTGQPVWSDLWENGRAMDHIQLSRWADFGVLCPASANTLAKAAQGLAEDLVGSLLLAWPKGKTLHIFPAMNGEMWTAEPTQQNVARLIGRGFRVHVPAAGVLACGEVGTGRLLEPEDILSRITRAPKGKILITGGATREPVDGIRFLSNVSTGQTASSIADLLQARGWETTYLHGQGAKLPAGGLVEEFTSFADLRERLQAHLFRENFAAVIHAAAVSDYSIDEVNGRPPSADGKVGSDADLSLKLRRNPKLLGTLKELAREKSVRVIGFKLTLGSSEAEQTEAARKILSSGVDAVVANDWRQVAADRSRHPGRLHLAQESFAFKDLPGLVDLLNDKILEGVSHGPVS